MVAQSIEKNVLWFHVITVSEDGPGVMDAYLPKIAFFWTNSAQHHRGGGKHGTNTDVGETLIRSQTMRQDCKCVLEAARHSGKVLVHGWAGPDRER